MRLSGAEIRLQGIPLGAGVARGRACFYQEAAPRSKGAAEDAIVEQERLLEALAWMSERLEGLARDAETKLNPDTADIFRAQRLILEDPTLRQRLFDAINGQGLNAEVAIEEQLEQYQAELRALDSEYLQERASDLADLQRSLLDRLRRVSPFLRCKDVAYCEVGQCRLGNDHILVAPELTPSLTLEVDSHTRGFLVEKGGPTSHAAILARALGLPAVSGIANLGQTVPLDARVLLDGDSGEVIINPSQATLDVVRERLNARPAPPVEPVPGFRVMANIDRSADVGAALHAAAEGIGLYRTEIEVLAKGRLLDEAEQTARYTEVVEAMPGKPVYIRLLDLGADKAADWLRLPPEDNPALGCRGARLLLARPELLRSQARALARAAVYGPIHVVYPMIVDQNQFHRLRDLVDSAVAGPGSGRLYHGIMFEVPSACLQARQLLEEADFGCIGTNDLVQYLFAADRAGETLRRDELFDHPVLWNVLGGLAETAKQAGKPLSLCGELGGDPRYVHRLIEAGITAISTDPGCIARVRGAARERGC